LSNSNNEAEAIDPSALSSVSRPSPIVTQVRTRTWAINGLFLLALIAALHLARELLLPVVVAVILHWVFLPAMRVMQKVRISAPLGAGIIVLGLLAVFAGGIYYLAEPASEWIEKAPQGIREIGAKLRIVTRPVKEVTSATEKVQDLAESIATGSAPNRRVQEVVVSKPSLAAVAMDAVTDFSVSAVRVKEKLYFLLASGDLFLRKIIASTPALADKKRAVDISRQIETEISSYLFIVTVINAVLACAVAFAMYLLGVPNPVLWGVMVGMLNFIPYLGDIVSFSTLTIVGLLTFDELWRSLLVPTVFYALTVTEGYLVTPLILGRRLRLNPVVIILSVLFWGWLWGIAGALLAVPILVVLKTVGDRIPSLKVFGEFLGA